MKKFTIIILFSTCFLLTACNSSSRPITVQNTQVLSSNVPPVPDGMKEKVAELLSDELDVTSIHIKRGESYLTAVITSSTVTSIWEKYNNYDDTAFEDWRALCTSLEEISLELPENLSYFSDGRPVSFQLMAGNDEEILLSIMNGKTCYDTIERIECRRRAVEIPPEEKEESEPIRDFSTSEFSSDTSETYVWIPKSGKRYHCISDCSGMKNARFVPISQAKENGLTACPNCY